MSLTLSIKEEQQLDLRKRIVLDLKKRKGIDNQKAQVVLSLDFSASMSSLYSNGSVQALVERLLPLGLAFDDNGEVDFYLFHQDFIKLKPITRENLAGFINKNVIGKYQMGSTNYAPVINKIVKDFQATGGFLGMGSKVMDLPVYVIMITDGNCDDRLATEIAIQEASNKGFFFQFVGIGIQKFEFLNKLDNLAGRLIDNANFFKSPDLGKTTDDELYSLLLGEFPEWLPLAKKHKLIK